MNNTHKTTISFLDLSFDLEYEYFPGEPSTFNTPGEKESYSIVSISLAGTELTGEQFKAVLDAYSAEALVDTIFDAINRRKQNEEGL